ncbi:unnamed protein product [Lactuca saligna]|uniref:Uncharacterized protein n=1 Tax=Lactuca saligna TaxID=75948 RepID=A0AA35ZWV2_LACSI|nr:unnamed protein product [Lactuca saligna]
MKRKSIDIA